MKTPFHSPRRAERLLAALNAAPCRTSSAGSAPAQGEKNGRHALSRAAAPARRPPLGCKQGRSALVSRCRCQTEPLQPPLQLPRERQECPPRAARSQAAPPGSASPSSAPPPSWRPGAAGIAGAAGVVGAAAQPAVACAAAQPAVAGVAGALGGGPDQRCEASEGGEGVERHGRARRDDGLLGGAREQLDVLDLVRVRVRVRARVRVRVRVRR